MLKENTLFGFVDKVDIAIRRLKLHERKTNGEGYYVAFSGGKDSCVVLDLCQRAGVKYDAHYNLTTVDPPELIRFIQKYHLDIWENRNQPELSMWQLIEKKRMPPTRIARYCCEKLKEGGGVGRIVVTGIRHQESAKRAKRGMAEPCYNKKKQYLHPIIDWSADEVWEYIHTYHVPYCSLYDEGFKRLGCVMCPYQGSKGMRRDMKRWPRISESYRQACIRAYNKAKADGLWQEERRKNWRSGDDMFRWWIGENHELQEDDRLISLFGMMMSETDT